MGQLLAAGAAVDWAGSSGKTPLWIAARHGHEAVGVGRPRLLMAVGGAPYIEYTDDTHRSI
eukprot:COSAG01_NODE_17954_length_1112_cov_0.826259_2_plen_60_part_01